MRRTVFGGPSGSSPSATMAFLALVVTVLALPGCSVTKQADVCVAANNDKVVTIVGYVKVAPFTVSSGDDFRIEVVESMSDDDGIGAYVKVGTGNNTMKKLAGEFTANDIELTLDDGSTEGYGDRVAFTGELTVNGDSCNIYDVDKLASP